MRLAALTLVALLQLASGQLTSTTSTVDSAATTNTASDTTASAAVATGSTTTTTADPITATIAVGQGGHVFSPSIVQLSKGNFVEFQFYPTNHSVIRAEYK